MTVLDSQYERQPLLSCCFSICPPMALMIYTGQDSAQIQRAPALPFHIRPPVASRSRMAHMANTPLVLLLYKARGYSNIAPQ